MPFYFLCRVIRGFCTPVTRRHYCSVLVPRDPSSDVGACKRHSLAGRVDGCCAHTSSCAYWVFYPFGGRRRLLARSLRQVSDDKGLRRSGRSRCPQHARVFDHNAALWRRLTSTSTYQKVALFLPAAHRDV